MRANRFTVTITAHGGNRSTSFAYNLWANIKGLIRDYSKVAQFDNIEVVDNLTGEIVAITADNYVSIPYGY